VKRLVAAAVAAGVVLTVATAARVSDPTGHARPAPFQHQQQHRRQVPSEQRSAARQQQSPDALAIPALGVHARLVAAGAAGSPGSAQLTVPADIHTVAWWDGDFSTGVHEHAARPGQPGVAVIAGHVDSAAAGPGALYNLAHLTAGDVVRVTLGGRTTTWTVARAPVLTPKTALPRALFRSTGPPRLTLVTCGGGFDAATGHYLDNVIVWAAPARTD
jgi:hypothetical protein